MWIVPTNHNLYSAFAPEFLDSKEALNEQLIHLGEYERIEKGDKRFNKKFTVSTLSLMWKSKPLSSQTWLRKWSQVYWIQNLFGRMLKPSMHGHFVGRYTASLADIHASRFPTQANAVELKMKDTFPRIYLSRLKSSDRNLFISKMSQGTYPWDMKKYEEVYQILATELRKESLLRRKLERHTEGRDSLFSELWKTPVSSDGEGGVLQIREGANAKYKLRDQAPHWGTPRVTTNGGIGYPDKPDDSRVEDQVMNWPTPTSMIQEQDLETFQNRKEKALAKKINGNGCGMNLGHAIQQWTTPSSLDWKDTPGRTAEQERSVTETSIFPLGQGLHQHEWEEPRTIESSMVYTVNGYNFTEDLHRAIGNSVVEYVSELAFITLLDKHIKNL